MMSFTKYEGVCSMRVALDTSVLAYAEGLGDEARCNAALQLVEQLPGAAVVLPAQTLGELMQVLTGQARRSSKAAREAVLGWADSFEVADANWSAFQAARQLVAGRHLPMWDALILAVAVENRCGLLLSEDLQDSFTWRGVTVVDPFAEQRSPLLSGLLATRKNPPSYELGGF